MGVGGDAGNPVSVNEVAYVAAIVDLVDLEISVEWQQVGGDDPLQHQFWSHIYLNPFPFHFLRQRAPCGSAQEALAEISSGPSTSKIRRQPDGTPSWPERPSPCRFRARSPQA